MTKTLDDLRRFDLEVEQVPLEKVDLHDANPNVLSEDEFAALRNDILTGGFVQPILARRRPKGRFQMLDGEHRYKILQEAQAETIPAVVIDEDDDDALLRLITMNRLRGRPAPFKLAAIIADLRERIPEDRLRERIGMDEREYGDIMRLRAVGESSRAKLRAVKDDRRPTKEVRESLVFSLRPADAKLVKRVLRRIQDDNTDRNAALVAMAKAIEKAMREGLL